MNKHQCPSCGGICHKSGCERDDIHADAIYSDLEDTRNILGGCVYVLSNILHNAKLIPDPDMNGATDIYSVPIDDIEAIRKIIGPESTFSQIKTKRYSNYSMAMNHLSDIESIMGGRNGPSIQLRSLLGKMLLPPNAAVHRRGHDSNE